MKRIIILKAGEGRYRLNESGIEETKRLASQIFILLSGRRCLLTSVFAAPIATHLQTASIIGGCFNKGKIHGGKYVEVKKLEYLRCSNGETMTLSRVKSIVRNVTSIPPSGSPDTYAFIFDEVLFNYTVAGIFQKITNQSIPDLDVPGSSEGFFCEPDHLYRLTHRGDPEEIHMGLTICV
ncbi:MAG: hypothetical protein WD003_01370 [Candidatus Paceibacterota bacterium]